MSILSSRTTLLLLSMAESWLLWGRQSCSPLSPLQNSRPPEAPPSSGSGSCARRAGLEPTEKSLLEHLPAATISEKRLLYAVAADFACLALSTA